MRHFFSLCFLLSAFCFSLGGCVHRLEPGGAYAPTSTNVLTGAVTPTQAADYPFFVTDTAFDFAFTAFTAASNAEINNRAFLFSVAPQIKHTLDKIRPQAWDAVKRYILARGVYLEHPTPAGLSELQTILTEVQNVSVAAQAALPKPK
jgi:hypothetical protein